MSIYEMESPTSDGLFVKFRGGDKIRLRMFGEPISYTATYPGQEPKVQFASRVLIANKDTKEYDTKLWTFGWTIQKALKELSKDADWGDPTSYDIEITAEGEKLERKYHVIPKPKKDLDEKAKKAISSCEIDMSKALKLTETPAGTTSAGSSDLEDDPFAD